MLLIADPEDLERQSYYHRGGRAEVAYHAPSIGVHGSLPYAAGIDEDFVGEGRTSAEVQRELRQNVWKGSRTYRVIPYLAEWDEDRRIWQCVEKEPAEISLHEIRLAEIYIASRIMQDRQRLNTKFYADGVKQFMHHHMGYTAWTQESVNHYIDCILGAPDQLLETGNGRTDLTGLVEEWCYNEEGPEDQPALRGLVCAELNISAFCARQ